MEEQLLGTSSPVPPPKPFAPHHARLALITIVLSVLLGTALSVALAQFLIQKTVDQRIENMGNELRLQLNDLTQQQDAKFAALDSQVQELKHPRELSEETKQLIEAYFQSIHPQPSAESDAESPTQNTTP